MGPAFSLADLRPGELRLDFSATEFVTQLVAAPIQYAGQPTRMIISVSAPHRSLETLRTHFQEVRRRTEELAAPLPREDQVVQTMANVSPTKWHLAHTTWFFETFVAQEFLDDYQPFDERFGLLFNSYYQGAGPCFERQRRGTIGRPTVPTVLAYRRHVDAAIEELFDEQREDDIWRSIVAIGLEHEQQHQELLLTDIKHVLSCNPLKPAYRKDCASQVGDRGRQQAPPPKWLGIKGDLYQIGYEGTSFCFDNEQPRHQVWLDDFEIATGPVLCGEYMEFIEDGGYESPKWWLSEGWQAVQTKDWRTPLYWERRQDRWWTMTLGGMRPVDALEPLCHVSYFEADAYARWRGARLPTEQEWEVASRCDNVEGNFADKQRFHPLGNQPADSHRFFGDVWEWTSSAYSAYPGFEPWQDTLGEYNGKFMCNQYVLRGGSCVTAPEQVRRTYRNFFGADARWQFSGFRLAR